MIENSHQVGDEIRRVTCDIAYDGGDSLVMWLWIGNHIEDVFVCGVDSQRTVYNIKGKLKEWRVLEENFMYDLPGAGYAIKGWFPDAIPFNPQEGLPEEDVGLYANLKSKCAYLFARDLRDKKFSMSDRLRDKLLSGRNFTNMPLERILMDERKVIRFVGNSMKGKELIKKNEMKKVIGRSPDYIESLIMKKKFDFDEEDKWVKPIGLGLL